MRAVSMVASGFILVGSSIASSQARTNLFKAETMPEEKPKAELAISKKASPIRERMPTVSNLPSYFLTVNRYASEDQNIILPAKPQSITDGRLKLGEIIEAELKEGVIAFAEGKVPVRALLKRGVYKGAVLIGEANLEKNSKRVTIDFKKARFTDSPDAVTIQGIALDSSGTLGIEGRLVSNESKYLTAEIASAAAAGAADATINRSQTAFGNYQEQPGADTIAKKALTAALTQTTSRMAEKLKESKEYVEVKAPQTIKILITE